MVAVHVDGGDACVNGGGACVNGGGVHVDDDVVCDHFGLELNLRTCKLPPADALTNDCFLMVFCLFFGANLSPSPSNRITMLHKLRWLESEVAKFFFFAEGLLWNMPRQSPASFVGGWTRVVSG